MADQRNVNSVRVSDPTTPSQQMAVDSSGFAQVKQWGSSTATAPAQTAVTTTASTILAANAARKRVMVQNTGTTVIKIVLGTGTPTQTAYHFALAASSAADTGTGGTYLDEMWTGAIKAISSGASGTVVVTELT